MKRSKRFEVLEKRPVHQDGFVQEWPEVGLIAVSGPNDPKPSIKIEKGRVVEMDGKPRSEFDMIDQFIADTAVKAATVDVIGYASPAKGTSLTNEAILFISGDSGAVRQALIAAREVGLKLLGTLGAAPASTTGKPYI